MTNAERIEQNNTELQECVAIALELPDAEAITIDNKLDSESTNPVQNKVITEALNAKADKATTYTKTEVDSLVANSGGGNGGGSSHPFSVDVWTSANYAEKSIRNEDGLLVVDFALVRQYLGVPIFFNVEVEPYNDFDSDIVLEYGFSSHVVFSSSTLSDLLDNSVCKETNYFAFNPTKYYKSLKIVPSLDMSSGSFYVRVISDAPDEYFVTIYIGLKEG